MADRPSFLNHFTPFPEALRGKRILLASESLGPINGVSRTTTQLILYLQKNGVDIKLVAPHYLGEKQQGHVRRLNGLPLPYSPELSVAYPFRLDRVCGNFKPDLIYLASPASVGFQVMLQARGLPNPPPIIANFQTDLAAYSDIIFPSPLDKYGSWLLQIVQSHLFNHPSVETVFYPSSPVRDYLVDSGVDDEKLVQLGRGVDTELFSPAYRDESFRAKMAPNGQVILLCVGRLAPEKGFKYLATIAIRLAQLYIPYKLVIVGGNRNPAVEQEVKNFFAPVADKVHFTGFLEGAALALAYASADIFLHCSVTETFGLVVLEAMACGLPVVARAAGGPIDILRGGSGGYLVAPDEESAFVEKAALLIQDHQLRTLTSIAARRLAESTTWEQINNRVAWQLVHAIEQNEITSTLPCEFSNTALDWIYAFICTIWVELKLTAAMGIVSLFWVIAVFPLMLHGNLMFPRSSNRQARQALALGPAAIPTGVKSV
ncbi:Serine/threonine-protein kinase [Venturia nashicola]|uniref:Serine/threonine-protein kinase n=1 Tax=Venturia nashicola TaxID=86259 RepID=A0A4Z1PIP7_9PEZI|nr:Serine/threonine-protein kinase [Venturia nashicola]